MKVTSIKVSAGRTFNHPYEQFSNLREDVWLKAQLEDDDNYVDSVKQLQTQADILVEEKKQHKLGSLRQEHTKNDNLPF